MSFIRDLILRNEIATETVRPLLRYLKRRRHEARSRPIIDAYFASHDIRKVQLGSGGESVSGWLNTDLTPSVPGEAMVDAAGRFPFPDQSCHYLAGEHVIEHLTYEGGLRMLRECFRVLKPGGRVRITTPDLEIYTALYTHPRPAGMDRFMEAKMAAAGWKKTASPACMIINMQVREWGHQFLYDRATLVESMTATGFTQIKEFVPGKSDDPHLQNADTRERVPDRSREVNMYESIVFEGVRP